MHVWWTATLSITRIDALICMPNEDWEDVPSNQGKQYTQQDFLWVQRKEQVLIYHVKFRRTHSHGGQLPLKRKDSCLSWMWVWGNEGRYYSAHFGSDPGPNVSSRRALSQIHASASKPCRSYACLFTSEQWRVDHVGVGAFRCWRAINFSKRTTTKKRNTLFLLVSSTLCKNGTESARIVMLSRSESPQRVGYMSTGRLLCSFNAEAWIDL